MLHIINYILRNGVMALEESQYKKKELLITNHEVLIRMHKEKEVLFTIKKRKLQYLRQVTRKARKNYSKEISRKIKMLMVKESKQLVQM